MVAATSGRNSTEWPIMCRSAGRANSSKLTRDDTGLPGRPNTGVPMIIAIHNGFDGRIATWYQSTRDAPSGSSTAMRSSAALT